MKRRDISSASIGSGKHDSDATHLTFQIHDGQKSGNFNLNLIKNMLAKYKIEYAIPFSRQDQPHHHLTDDPVACEEILTELLERGFKIKAVLHDGVPFPKLEFDKLIKTAAGMLATNHICRSLGIDRAEAHHRFGSTA